MNEKTADFETLGVKCEPDAAQLDLHPHSFLKYLLWNSLLGSRSAFLLSAKHQHSAQKSTCSALIWTLMNTEAGAELCTANAQRKTEREGK